MDMAALLGCQIVEPSILAAKPAWIGPLDDADAGAARIEIPSCDQANS
jgi:hypothetical protein